MHARESLSPYRQDVGDICEAVCREINYEYYQYGHGQGALRNCRDNLRLLLEERFGALPPEVVREIEDTSDLYRLKMAQAQALTMTAATELSILWEEWRAELYRGRSNGVCENCRDDLVALLRERFGNVPAAVVRGIETTRDVGQLQTWLRQTVHAQALEEFMPQD